MPAQPSINGQRARVLWTLLKWEGAIVNARVRAILNLKTVQASRMIASLDAGANLIEFNRNTKHWVPRPGLATAREIEQRGGDFDEYTTLLDRGASENTWFIDARTKFLEPRAEQLRVVREACVSGRGLKVCYHSMTSPEGRDRVIYPHAVIRLAQRWHVRALCAERLGYRDFNLGRLTPKQLLDEVRPASAPPDTAWETIVEASVAPHDDLEVRFWDVVRREYFPRASARRLRERAALLPYALQVLRVAIDPTTQRPPEYLLQLRDPERYRQWLFRSGEGTAQNAMSPNLAMGQAPPAEQWSEARNGEARHDR